MEIDSCVPFSWSMRREREAPIAIIDFEWQRVDRANIVWLVQTRILVYDNQDAIKNTQIEISEVIHIVLSGCQATASSCRRRCVRNMVGL